MGQTGAPANGSGDPGSRARPPGWFKGLVIAAATGLVLSLVALVVVGIWEPGTGADRHNEDLEPGMTRLSPDGAENGPRSPLDPDYGLESLRIPDFELVDQDGQTVDATIFDGRVSVVAFIFTHCPYACPEMTRRMMQVRDELEGEDRVQFVSLSVDPVNDTPERLRAYAEENEIEIDRWTFLTGEAGAVERIVQEDLGFALYEEEATRVNLPGGKTMSNIVHPTRLLLIGPDRRVLGLYSSGDPGAVGPMADRARQVLEHLN